MSDQYYSLTVKLSNFSVFFINNILIYTIFYIPIILLFLLFIIPKKNIILIRDVSLIGTFYIFILTIFIMVLYNISSFTTNTSIFQFHYVSDTIYYLFNIKYVLGVDGISILLNVLTALLIPLCILVNINTIKYRLKEFIILLVILEILLLNTFSVLNIIFFYIFFEAILIPMFIMIGI